MNLSERTQIALLRATQSPMGVADWVGHGISRWHATGVLARRLGCYIGT
jgi:hypothetical protein